MHATEAPVLVVKPDGAVLRGTANIEMVDEHTCRVSDVVEGVWPNGIASTHRRPSPTVAK